MRRIGLTVDGAHKYEIIKELVDQNGNKNRAAKRLSCSRRSIDRYIKGYKECGKAFFIHGNTNRVPVHKIASEIKDTISDLYRNKYYDATYQLFTELLKENEGINVSEAVVRNTYGTESFIASSH